MTDEELFARVRAIHDALKLLHDECLGPKIDKKLFRFNDVVATARRYEAEGAGLQAGLREAVQCCVVGHSMHVPGRGPLSLLETFDLTANA